MNVVQVFAAVIPTGRLFLNLIAPSEKLFLVSSTDYILANLCQWVPLPTLSFISSDSPASLKFASVLYLFIDRN